MQSFTNKDKKKYKIILFLKNINCCKKKLFSQTKTYFCYFNIAFEMSCRVVFLVFGVINTKYLPFRTPNELMTVWNCIPKIFLFKWWLIIIIKRRKGKILKLSLLRGRLDSEVMHELVKFNS